MRRFGLIFAMIFTVISLRHIFSSGLVQKWALFPAALFLIVAIFKPDLLKWFYTAWVKLGDILGYINSRIIMGILFFFLFVPLAAVLRCAGRDYLNRRIDKKSSSYWHKRTAPLQPMHKLY